MKVDVGWLGMVVGGGLGMVADWGWWLIWVDGDAGIVSVLEAEGAPG